MRRIDQRGQAFVPILEQRGPHTIEILGQRLIRRHDVAERDECRAIARFQAVEHGAARGLQMAEPETLQARAHVEREHDVQGNLLEAGEIDRLPHAIVHDFEIGRHRPCTGWPFAVTSTSTRTASMRLEKVCADGAATASASAPASVRADRSSPTRDPPAASASGSFARS